MPDLVRLRDIVDTFSEQDLDLIVPIDFKDADSESLPYINTYNGYLASKQYEQAYQYRLEHSDILEPLIIDAKKLNIQQAIMINTYLFAKGERSAENLLYNNTESGLTSDNLQGAVDELLAKIVANATQSNEYSNELYNKSYNRHVFVKKLPANPDPDTFYYLEET